MSFSIGFESLPFEAQQAYTRFQQNKNLREFGAALRHLLLEESLDELLQESPAFLHAAVELVGSRYPHLNLQGRLDGMITLTCRNHVLIIHSRIGGPQEKRLVEDKGSPLAQVPTSCEGGSARRRNYVG
jgi:hypothetical protein